MLYRMGSRILKKKLDACVYEAPPATADYATLRLVANAPEEKLMRKISAIVLLALLGACAQGSPGTWYRDGATIADLDRDSSQCQAEANGVGPRYETCMRRKGWILR